MCPVRRFGAYRPTTTTRRTTQPFDGRTRCVGGGARGWGVGTRPRPPHTNRTHAKRWRILATVLNRVRDWLLRTGLTCTKSRQKDLPGQSFDGRITSRVSVYALIMLTTYFEKDKRLFISRHSTYVCLSAARLSTVSSRIIAEN
jgi:hypothetical protein